ncbi:carbohydrate kinase, partial [Clostridium butyricum]
NISMDKWKEIIAFANKVGAITCTNYGAINSMPIKEDIEYSKWS